MIIVRQACLLTGFGNPRIGVAATAVSGILHVFGIQ
jgi:hypothetical protein